MANLRCVHKFASKAEYIAAVQAYEQIEKWCIANPFHLLEKTYANFCFAYSHVRSELIQVPRMKMKDVRVELNSALIALLSMMRFYLDAMETSIQREGFAAKDRVLANFKNAQAKEYDNVFEYRFAYKLRNYAQHCNFPLSDVRFNTQLSPDTGKEENEFEACFDHQRLLREYNGWGQVKKDLAQGSGKLEAMSVLQTVMVSLKNIEQAKILAILPRLKNSALLLQSLIEHAKGMRGSIYLCLMHNFKQIDKQMTSTPSTSQILGDITFSPIEEVRQSIDMILSL